jgi:hypothetical protein
MDVPAPVLLVAGIVVAAALLWIVAQVARRPAATPRFLPTNELERLLAASAGETGVSREVATALRSATLLGLEGDDGTGVPMDFAITFPADFQGRMEGLELNEEGKVQFGPWVVCFSSPAIVEGLSKTFMSGLVTQVGEVRQYSAREIFESALERRLDVILNPFYGVTRRFTQEEIRQIVDAG